MLWSESDAPDNFWTRRPFVGKLLTEPLPDHGSTGVVRQVPDDSWGNPYVYERSGSEQYTLRGAGEDETLGTSDDLVLDIEK